MYNGPLEWSGATQSLNNQSGTGAPLKEKSENRPEAFEQALQELEQLVDQLEKGDLSLDESLQRFERGVGLARTCQQALRDAEQRVQTLSERSADAPLQDFGTDEQQ